MLLRIVCLELKHDHARTVLRLARQDRAVCDAYGRRGQIVVEAGVYRRSPNTHITATDGPGARA